MVILYWLFKYTQTNDYTGEITVGGMNPQGSGSQTSLVINSISYIISSI